MSTVRPNSMYRFWLNYKRRSFGKESNGKQHIFPQKSQPIRSILDCVNIVPSGLFIFSRTNFSAFFPSGCRIGYQCECPLRNSGQNCELQGCGKTLASTVEPQFITRGLKPEGITACSWTITAPRYNFLELTINLVDPLDFVTMTLTSGTQTIKLTGNTQDKTFRSPTNMVVISYVEVEDMEAIQFIIAYKTGRL